MTINASLLGWSGRAVGLAWTLLFSHNIGIVGYGIYAMAYSLSGVFAGPVDNIFLARSIRVPDDMFRSDRCVRSAVVLFMAILGFVATEATTFFHFACIFAAGELALNTLKSSAYREGRVHRVQAIDIGRQLTSIALGAPYIIVAPTPHLSTVLYLYSIPYFFAILLVPLLNRPRLTGGPSDLKEVLSLASTALAGAGYAQGDVILIGIVAGPKAAGTYAIASLVAWAAASAAMNYAQAHIPEFQRDLASRLGAYPQGYQLLCLTLALGTGLGALALVSTPLRHVSISLFILGIFVYFRSWNYILGLRLTLLSLDQRRLLGTTLAACTDLILVFALAFLGPAGASLAASIAEGLLYIMFMRSDRESIGIYKPAEGIN